MAMKEELLAIDKIKVDEKYYPRMKWGWQTAYQYAMAIKAGAKFPPIEVAKIKEGRLFKGERIFLVDGRHRIEALKINKEKHVQAVINTDVKTLEQLFLLAVKRNISHGRPFSTQEKTSIALKLRKMDFKEEEISKIIQVPIEKFEKFISSRVTNSVSGEKIPLKKAVKHVASSPVKENFEGIQDGIHSGTSQIVLLDDFITLLENDLLQTENKEVMKRVSKIINLVFELEKKLAKVTA